MPWKRTRAGMPIRRSRKFSKAGSFRTKKRVGQFKKKVRAIARAVVNRQADLKQYDQFAPSAFILSSASTPSAGLSVLGFIDLTSGPGQGTTGSTRIGNKIRAVNSQVRWSATNTGDLAFASSNKSVYLRCAVLEMPDQKDEGNILTIPGNAMFERNSVNQDMQFTTLSRMQEYFNKRIYRVLSDKVYTIGCANNADKNKTVSGYYKHSWGGQEWSFETTAASSATERRMYMVWFIDSQDHNRAAGATHEVRMDLDISWRLNFTD